MFLYLQIQLFSNWAHFCFALDLEDLKQEVLWCGGRNKEGITIIWLYFNSLFVWFQYTNSS